MRTLSDIVAELPADLSDRIILATDDTPMIFADGEDDRDNFISTVEKLSGKSGDKPMVARRARFLNAKDVEGHVNQEEFTMIEDYDGEFTPMILDKRGECMLFTLVKNAPHPTGSFNW